MKLTDSEIEVMAERIGESVHPLRVLLFGSYADGTATDDSDLDLFVIMETSEPRYKRGSPIRNLFWPPRTSMDILVYTPEEVERWNGVPNHIVTEVLRSGKVLYAA